MDHLSRSPAFDDYWKFAAKRHEAYLSRAQGQPGPWTDDPIIAKFRFTNTFRAADRVSQFLIRHIQYDRSNDLSDEDILFRTLLFKIFNNIDTWKSLEREFGQIRWIDFNFGLANDLLEAAISSGRTIYSAAYIMPSPAFGAKRKHTNHLRLLKSMMEERLTQHVTSANSLQSLYHTLLNYKGLGPFLAFQYAIDINYSQLTDFEENEFVVAGPGAHDGIRKVFPDAAPNDAEDIIHWMVERQDREFERLGIDFEGLFGRKLRAIDCQNIFCEISKYCRVAHPSLQGISGRKRIKQSFSSSRRSAMPAPFFPPKWKINDKIELSYSSSHCGDTQAQLELSI
ncbi:hypothetical protein K3181_00530 [Qipengyuania sp. YG27]|uniref:5-hmdU DNA kinase helical domain-containing protein n=1 Tax=Qipengyuania mesophila TaxID=2867246 RepID=A0ABS7JQL8_9SPHN|nr:nucleotide kinase domain-containing protein [Qipengyuania mesophila]MBX7499924.1 hypothetical protein [Qipengyuania mesophila]